MIGRLPAALLIVGLLAGCGSRADSARDRDTTPATGDRTAGVMPDCPGPEVALDIPGPGMPTPDEAVAPYAKGTPKTVKQTSQTALVHDLSARGTVLRIFDVSKHEDGWWPDGYVECAT